MPVQVAGLCEKVQEFVRDSSTVIDDLIREFQQRFNGILITSGPTIILPTLVFRAINLYDTNASQVH